MTAYRWLVPLCACIAFSGCATVSGMKEDVAGLFGSKDKGQPALDAGAKAFEDGEYREAQKQLQTSLDAGLGKSNQARAHKYLAFIYCVTDRMQQCRSEFGKALDADPSFELRDDEVGHPVWGPAFRAVKAGR
jgi:Tfp pilus assembly protein PilF